MTATARYPAEHEHPPTTPLVGVASAGRNPGPQGDGTREKVVTRMELSDAARALIGAGSDATLVTVNADGTPQVSVVWVGLESTADGDEIVTAHLGEHKKVRNIRHNPLVKLTIIDTKNFGKVVRPYLAVTGTARIVEGGAPELLTKLAKAVANPGAEFPPHDAPPGYVTRIRIDTVGGTGPWKPNSRI